MQLTWVDYLVIGGYLAAITAFGSWFARFQKTTRDYFLTDRSVPWWAVCFTIVATETSTLTFIGIPAAGVRRQHDVSAAGARLRHRPHHRQPVVHSGVLPRRSLHLVRTAAATLRDARQDAVRRHLSDHAIARRRHPAVCDGARHRGRDRRAGAVGRHRPRRRDDRLHRARRRVGGDLDRRRPDVRLHRRAPGRSPSSLLDAHSRRLGRRWSRLAAPPASSRFSTCRSI